SFKLVIDSTRDRVWQGKQSNLSVGIEERKEATRGLDRNIGLDKFSVSGQRKSFTDVVHQEHAIKDLLHSAVLDRGKHLAKWLTNIRPWKGKEVSLNRLVWLQCFGVPLQTWGMFFCARLTSFWGTLIRLDEIRRKKESFDRAWLLVLMHEVEWIIDSVQLEVNDHTFSIKVVEDSGGNCVWSENVKKSAA
ncbi:hypothetical protein Ancab_033622, partial [Ancistrocladus abbreviatus]